ncbi:MAG: ABC-2 family transporter protein [Actinomycetota bacterium]
MDWVRHLRRNVFLYRRGLGAHIRSTMEYEADFWVLIFASVLMQVVGLVFLWAVFRRIPDINGWAYWDIVMIYAMVFFAEGIGSLFFEGTWRLAWLVNQGELDRYLVRPFSPVLQVMSGEVGVNGLGNIVLGTILIATAAGHVDVRWTLGRVLLAAVLLASAVVIKLSINLATNASAFWLASPFSTFAFAMHSLGDLARYPITIYSLGIRALITAAIPFAFISFFPAAAILHRGPTWWIGLLTPAVAAYCLFVATAIFRRGLRRYDSAGA